ncbi:uncharacterized protein LOC114525095 [Dendronephthya gigantea]|uniref:uncharacterized protein LOC114525095 n=1 Tax=Dendronephthya gigantea TaxID=151771 RepID=UPI00106992DB|nr:uncharacterized protein LOC114525095 [Dendronephthya gigantea]
MGVYGRYGKVVCVISSIQIGLGGLMICLGIALRVTVCSWVTDASFGFWVGFLVLIGGIFGYCSATKDNYTYISLYLGSNSFSIMFTMLAIFCHSIAFVHFNHQMQPLPPRNHTNATNSTNSSLTTATWNMNSPIRNRRGARTYQQPQSSLKQK